MNLDPSIAALADFYCAHNQPNLATEVLLLNNRLQHVNQIKTSSYPPSMVRIMEIEQERLLTFIDEYLALFHDDEFISRTDLKIGSRYDIHQRSLEKRLLQKRLIKLQKPLTEQSAEKLARDQESFLINYLETVMI